MLRDVILNQKAASALQYRSVLGDNTMSNIVSADAMTHDRNETGRENSVRMYKEEDKSEQYLQRTVSETNMEKT